MPPVTPSPDATARPDAGARPSTFVCPHCGAPVPAFAYHDFGSLVSLADYDAFGSLGQFGLLKGVTLRGHLAHFSHVMQYRSHQAKLHGFWRGGLLWLIDWLNARARRRSGWIDDSTSNEKPASASDGNQQDYRGTSQSIDTPCTLAHG